jgi:hypothetical protein
MKKEINEKIYSQTRNRSQESDFNPLTCIREDGELLCADKGISFTRLESF